MSFGKLHKDTFNIVLSFLPDKTILKLNAVTTAVRRATQEWIEYNQAGDLIFHCHDEILTTCLLDVKVCLWADYIYRKTKPNRRAELFERVVVLFHLVVDIKPKPLIFEARITSRHQTNDADGMMFEIDVPLPMGSEHSLGNHWVFFYPW